MGYYIGIDGGGTTCRLLAADASGTVLGRGVSGSTNLASNTAEAVYDNLNRLFIDFFDSCHGKLEDCAGLCIGSAGIDNEARGKQMRGLISRFGFTCPIQVINDSELALAAATGGEPGVVVISGTGSIAMGMNADGTIIRSGGWGHLLDDAGSAYWIGREALSLVMRAYDGRCERTVLEESLTRALGVSSPVDFIDQVYSDGFGKPEIARLSIYVTEGALAGDMACARILDKAAEELFQLVDAVLNRLQSKPDTVTASGGTIVNGKLLFGKFAAFMSQKYPDIRIEKIQKEPVEGALLLAMKRS